MKRKTQALYARHATIKSSAASLDVHQARASVRRVEELLTQSTHQAQQDTAHIHSDLSLGASAATFALDFSSQLQHQHQAALLRDELRRELDALKSALATQQQMRRKEKSAQKMGEQLDAKRLIELRRRQQLEQDELVCHVFDLSA